ncbi:hypothetical protein GCM10023093_26840 [Nemorincola caseinilytica]|uniref:DUF1573 domain-containing protein n=2 Tax=Nemorincola caseinilytica TaxID=2054315 RepID=A0ABP8NMB1_9BACT
MSCSVLLAQDKKSKKDKKKENRQTEISTPAPSSLTTSNAVAVPAATSLNADDLAFADMVHDFGTVPEGPDASFSFTFKNNGKEPIIIQKAQPSCGCTVPSFSGEPVPPGATGKIDVSYHTKGRPNAFTKSITVVSNAGTKVLTIKGNVEKAPVSSVPENTSMMKTN